MFRVQWTKVKRFVEGVEYLRELGLTKELRAVAHLKTGAKLYGKRDGIFVDLYVSGYAQDRSDLPQELFS